MAEQEENDGSWSGLVKTIIGTVGTIVTAGGAWLGSQLFSGEEEKAEQPAAQVVAPAPVINITNSQQNANTAPGKTIVIKEKAAAPAAAPKKKTEKEELEEAPKW